MTIKTHGKKPVAGFNRRDILKTGLSGMLGMIPALALADQACAQRLSLPGTGAFEIAFYNLHTGEHFDGPYRVGHKYLPEAFERINHILRDFRTGEAFPIDPRALDILYALQKKTGAKGRFEILSAYRSPKTNAMLRRVGTGVAQNSLHMTGQALDIRLPSYSTYKLGSAARGLQAGGVGYYKKSNFVHVDTGKIRHWYS